MEGGASVREDAVVSKTSAASLTLCVNEDFPGGPGVVDDGLGITKDKAALVLAVYGRTEADYGCST